MKVNVNWLLNHMIHNNRNVIFIRWDDVDKPKEILGTWEDRYDKENPGILSAEIDYFVIKNDKVEVIVK